VVIWQQNINKSPSCQHTLISNNILVNHNISIIALQEPSINSFNNSIAAKDWTSVYLTTHHAHPEKTHTLTLIHSAIPTNSWEQIDFPSGDIMLLALKGNWGKLIIFNIYNDGGNDETIKKLTHFHSISPDITECPTVGETHILWLGDFNQHHPHWDDPNDTWLFTKEALKAAETLIEVVVALGLDLALPSRLPTHLHNVTKK
jgi:retrotransposon-encoded endonuclease